MESWHLCSYFSDTPMPILPAPVVSAWSQRPATVITRLEGQEVIDHAPPAVGVDPDALGQFLLKLADAPKAVEIVQASRLYRTALELIETRPDIAYQLLISTVESFANVALAKYEPEDSEKLNSGSAARVRQRARTFGLDVGQASQLALEASQGNPWSKRKFKKFLLDFASRDELSKKDQVFIEFPNLWPPVENLEETLSRVFEARSGNLHRAHPFPRWVGVGTSPSAKFNELPVGVFTLQPAEVPPVTWFERVVSVAARKFLLDTCSISSLPFV